MKKIRTKKLLSVLIIMFVALSSTSVFAADSTFLNNLANEKRTLIYGPEEGIKVIPYSDDVCNGKPYHDLVSSGFGTAYRGAFPSTDLIVEGACWQCDGCYLVMVTEGEPILGEDIGTWATYPYDEPISGYGAVIWTNTYGNCSSPSMSGYHFRY